MRIGELSARSGVSARTIRYYEAIGVLAAPPRTAAGYRDYDQSAVRRLRFVRAAQSLGLGLAEIREIIGFRDRGQTPCGHVAELIELHANDLAERIQALRELHGELTRLAKLARRAAPAPRDSAAVCHIIESPGQVPG